MASPKKAKRTTTTKSKSKSKRPRPLFQFKASYDVTFSQDGTLLASASKSVPLIWDVATGKQITKCETSKNTKDVALSPDATLLAGFDTSGQVSVCDAQTGKRIATLDDCDTEGSFIRFSPDGEHLVVSNWVGAVWAWSTHDWSAERVIAVAGEYCEGVFLGDGSLLLGANLRGRDEPTPSLSIWDWPPGEDELRRIACDFEPDHLALDPKVDRVAISSMYKKMAIINLATGAKLHDIETDYPKALAFSPTEEKFAAMHKDVLFVYDSETWAPISRMDVKFGSALAFSPDGMTLAVGSWERGELWNVNQLPPA